MNNTSAKRWTQVGFAALSYSLLCANRPNCDGATGNITCSNFSITVQPGTCTQFSNPCADGLWTTLPEMDGIRFCSPHDGLTISTVRSGRTQVRSICAASNAPAMSNQEVTFVYGRSSDFGEASVFVTTFAPLAVNVSATPSVIDVGGGSQLLAAASGGTAPYTYAWTPVAGLSNANTANPIATPVITTQYNVLVTDATGSSVSGTATVNVRSTLVVSANPPTINVGESSQLSATGAGGTPPYTFSWVPIGTLNDATLPDPIATPANTTTYVLTMTDSAGDQIAGSVTVTVNLSLNASATPSTISAGGTSALTVVVQGGTPPYQYAWSPPSTLDNSLIQSPHASPAATTTYTVDVVDAGGLAAQTQVTVTVAAAGPTACFVLINGDGLIGNASCSTGNIVSYQWDYAWTPANPDQTTTGPMAIIPYAGQMPRSVTLTVVDNNGASNSTTRTF